VSVTPRGMSIQEAYREYRAGNFQVNRRYQRKLVWTLDEKRALIDSVLHGYPIPLILLAYTTHASGTKTFEILDGMQRLNALFTFIENEFSVEDKFFDVEQLSRARQLANDGIFHAVRATDQLLAPEACANFLDYTLAVTEFPASDEKAVHEVFGRINSYGHQLSDQEKRQAGVISPFANVVREMAAEIRGDVSKDTLDLSQMPAISVDIAGEAPSYAVKADSTFWCKQGILRRSMLRDSEDEQMIADLCISILEGKPFAFSGTSLDEYYNHTSEAGSAIDKFLAMYGASRLKTDIIGTLSVLRETIEDVDSSPNYFRRVVHPDSGSNPVKTAFFAVFGAFFELCVVRRKSPGSNKSIMRALASLQSKLNVAAGQIRSEPRKQNIQLTVGLIQDLFEDKEPPVLLHGAGSSISFENALRRSRIENASYECKQGLLRLDASRSTEPALLDRIVETICGIANIGPDTEGAVFVGVADSQADKDRIENLDRIVSAHIGSRFVVGIDREARHEGVSLETYKRKIVDHIGSSGLSNPLKADILAKIDCIAYRGQSVICIWIPPQKSLSNVSDRVFVRQGSSTKEATGAAAITAVFQRFQR
jgi:hypothetical protein